MRVFVRLFLWLPGGFRIILFGGISLQGDRKQSFPPKNLQETSSWHCLKGPSGAPRKSAYLTKYHMTMLYFQCFWTSIIDDMTISGQINK